MKALRFLTVAAFAAATVPRLAHRGMFVDGITYASIARNLAEGRGSFWAPSYTSTIYPEFHDHPPLGLWLQSLWFRVLGDHLFVERAYSITAAVLTAVLIALLWRRLAYEPGTRKYEWLPVLLWTAIPVVSWSIVGNLLETTVSAFTTAAVVAALCANLANGRASAAGCAVLSGVCVVAAALTKGPVGLFPLAAPILFAFPTREWRHWRASLVAQWATVVVCAAVLLSVDPARSSLARYFDQQVLAAISGRREVSGSSLTILKELLQGIVVPIAILAGLVVGLARRFAPPSREQQKAFVGPLMLGLAGTLPILASPKQAGHYLVPAVPLYAIAAAGFLVPTVRTLVDSLSFRHFRGVMLLSAAIGIGTIVAASLPTIGRDRQRLTDLDMLEPAVPRGTTIGICPESNDDWGLHAWFERRFLVSLDATQSGQQRRWFLKTSAYRGGCPPDTCTAVTDASRDLVLLRCSPR
jgi:4-amino-4-deoxy-L-arabinose transferase-like glycosyltransferase